MLDSNETTSTPEVLYEIVHAIPGRIRFSIPELTTDSDYADKVKALLESDSNVKNVRLNSKAASIVISYKSDSMSDDQIRAHIVNLIQTAPKVAPVKQATTKSIVAAIMDAIVNLIDSLRNVNKARKGITDGEYKTDFWERALQGTKSITKKLREALMFILPKRQLTTEDKVNK